MNKNAKYWINKLNLKEHLEGGYFAETYESERLVTLPEYDGPRHVCTAIYYMLTGEQFASFHTTRSDELWHFYAGSSLTLYIIERDDGRLSKLRLGAEIDKEELLQAVVKSCSWFAASINDTTSYSLVGCTVSPGFDLVTLYPQHQSAIEKYTRS